MSPNGHPAPAADPLEGLVRRLVTEAVAQAWPQILLGIAQALDDREATMDVLTTDEAAAFLKVTPRYLDELRRRGKIRAAVGGQRNFRFTRADLRRYLEAQK